jgi:hypothetical protein
MKCIFMLYDNQYIKMILYRIIHSNYKIIILYMMIIYDNYVYMITINYSDI